MLICSSFIKRGSQMRWCRPMLLYVLLLLNQIMTWWMITNSEAFQNLLRKLSHLTPEEQTDMKKLLFEFWRLFPDMPSCTTCVFHDVEAGSARPCRQHPYKINLIKLQYLQKEIKYMLKNKIIEPSCNEWSSPCVLLPKPDGTYRLNRGLYWSSEKSNICDHIGSLERILADTPHWAC